MGLYHWNGPGKIEQIDLPRAIPPVVVAPTGPDIPGAVDEKIKLFICTVCDRKFRKAMIVARHFNSSHSDMKKDAETWRGHMKDVFE